MNKTWLLLKQNYLQKVQAKSFIAMTLLYVAIILVALNWSSITSLFSSDDDVRIALIDQTKQMGDSFPMEGDTSYMPSLMSEAEAKKNVKNGAYDGALFLEDDEGKLQATLMTEEPLSLNDQQSLETLVDSASKVYRIQQLNLSSKEAASILAASTPIKEVSLKAASSKSTEDKVAGVFISYAIGFLIYLFVITYASMITTDIASEKGSRVLEVLMASVRPNQHLFAKIVSVILVGCTQILILIAAALIAINIKGGDMQDSIKETFSSFTPSYFWFVLAFVVLTLLLYVTLGAFLGSLVSKVEEAGQAAMPLTFMMMAGFFTLVYGMSNPDIALVKVLSYVPFTSGMLMPLRYSATDLSVSSVWISLLILIITLVAVFYATVSMYRRSVLTYSTGSLIEKFKNVMKFTT